MVSLFENPPNSCFYRSELKRLAGDAAVADSVICAVICDVVTGNLAGYFEDEVLKDVAAAFGFSDSVAAVVSDALTLVDGKPLVLANKIVDAFGLGKYVTSVNAWRKVSRQFCGLLKKV